MDKLDNKKLRNFAFTFGITLTVVFGLLLPWMWSHSYPLWPWIILAVSAMWGLVAPNTLAPVYRGWMVFSDKIAWINNGLILGLVFFLILFPLGAVRRMFGWDAMKRKYEPQARSYRINKSSVSKEQFERLF